jgi:hypothetical protein
MPLTEDALVDRVRALLVALPFAYSESPSLETFELQPNTVEPVFRVQFVASDPRGGIGFTEEVVGDLIVSVALAIAADYDACRRALTAAGRAVFQAIVTDGTETSGEYGVEDGRQMDIVHDPPSAAFLTLRLTVPVNFEATL